MTNGVPGGDQFYSAGELVFFVDVVGLPAPPILIGTVIAGGRHNLGESPAGTIEGFLFGKLEQGLRTTNVTRQRFPLHPPGDVKDKRDVIPVHSQSRCVVEPLCDSLRLEIVLLGGIAVGIIHPLSEVKSIENN